MDSRRESSTRGQATVEAIGVLMIVALILGAVATSGIERPVVDGLRCGVSRILGSASSCPGATSGLGGDPVSGQEPSGGRTGEPVVRADALPPPAGYEMYIAGLNTYCSSHPHQRYHPEAPGMPWIPCASYERARREELSNTGSVKKCVQNVLAGAGLGATRGLYLALKDADVGAAMADIFEIVKDSSLEGAAEGGVTGAALACLWGLLGG